MNNLFKKYTIEEINSIIYTYDFLTETTNDGLFFSELLKYLTVTAINNDTKLNDNIKKFFTLSNIDYFTNLFNKEQQNELLINRLLNIETKTIRDFISLKTLQYSFQNNENLILDYCNKYLNYCEKKAINFLGLDFVESIKILKKETTFTEIKNILNDFPDMNSTNELDFIFSSLYINYLLKKNMNFEEYKKVLFYSKIGVTSNNKNDLINIHLFYNFKFVISKQILSYQNNIYFDYFVTEEIRKDLKKEVEKSLAISEKEYLNQILDKHIVSNKVKSKI